MFARWKGPATVVECLKSDSYKVEFDGKQYDLHPNHLRPYHITADVTYCSGIELQRCADEILHGVSLTTDNANETLIPIDHGAVDK